MYLETMGEILPRVSSKIILDDEMKGILPLLDLNGRVRSQGEDG